MPKKIQIITFVLFVIGVTLYFTADYFTVRVVPQRESLTYIHLPEGFQIEVFAENLGGKAISTPGPSKGARMMVVKDDKVYVAVPGEGSVIVLSDSNNDGSADERGLFISGLRNPHNVDFFENWVYIAEEDKIIRVKDENVDHMADPDTKEVLVNLPTGGHWTRTVKILNEKMFIVVGSSCNVCEEKNETRAAIQICELDGSKCKIYASGLRNAVDFMKYDGVIYATENGRDYLGNELPPDEINIIQEGKNYGWPVCYGKKMHDGDFDKKQYKRNPCEDTEESFVDLPAHHAPLGLSMYEGNVFPKEYKNKLFVAYHGSWNRQPPAGYKVVTVDLDTKKVQDFATGWLEGEVVRGRPVGIINWKDSLLISDDLTGKIYRISYAK